jgi:membrane protease YdiL (CAAX protease family)
VRLSASSYREGGHLSDTAALKESGSPSNERLAAELRGFGPLGILAILVILAGNLIVAPLSAVLVLLWARVSRTPWREIGYVRPRSWIGDLALGLVFGVAFKLFMKSIVMPLLGAPPLNPAFQFLVGNPAAVAGILFSVTVGAGFGEETLFRGYMFERLSKLFGRSVGAKVLIVLVTSVVFGVAHFPEQGLAGAEQGAIVGLVFGTIFAATGRIWMLMVAHAAFDLAAVAIIYWDLESEIAHLIFK